VELFYVIEFLIKVVSFGFIWNTDEVTGKNLAYLSVVWNLIDFFVVVTSLAAVLSFDDVNPVLVSFRVIRVLKILILMQRNQGMLILIKSIMLSIPSFIKILLLCFIFFFF